MHMINSVHAAFSALALALASRKAGTPSAVIVPTEPEKPKEPQPEPDEREPGQKPKPEQLVTLRVVGKIPPEVWNRLGTKVLPKLKSGTELQVGITLTATFTPGAAAPMETLAPPRNKSTVATFARSPSAGVPWPRSSKPPGAGPPPRNTS
jgi:hypothetical protein